MANERYESARKMYQTIGVDTEKAIEILKNVPVSMHCWQGDDVIGFDSRESLSGEFRQRVIIQERQLPRSS